MMNSKEIISGLEKVRSNAPLVHNITNYVVMNSTANALLSVGASPVMAHAVEEVEDMVGIASSLVINMGTLSEKWIEAMLIAGKKATDKGIPVVFDPVGVGVGTLQKSWLYAMPILKPKELIVPCRLIQRLTQQNFLPERPGLL